MEGNSKTQLNSMKQFKAFKVLTSLECFAQGSLKIWTELNTQIFNCKVGGTQKPLQLY